MKRILFVIAFLIGISSIFSQKMIVGIVSAENGSGLSNVVVLNVRSQDRVISTVEGNFSIETKTGDEIRFVKDGFERFDLKIMASNYSLEQFSIILIPQVIVIEEVKIKPSLSGNLSKDASQLNESSQKRKLNNDVQKYVKENPIEIERPKFEQGQVNLLSISSNGESGGVVSAVTKLFKKPKTSIANNYAARDAFFRQVKSETNLSYFENLGMNEYDFDVYLAYLDERHHFYNRKIGKNGIQDMLKTKLDDYLNLKKEEVVFKK